MHFKHPEILYFLFLLLIPLLVHLFQLRRFKKEYFTNVRFLKELSVQTRKSSQLKKYLLLATRCLVLSALVFAFAQPFFEAKDNKGTANEMYVLLDNSFSMQAKGKKGELLRRAIEDLLEHTPENQHFSLLTNQADFWNTDIRSIRKELQNLPYSGIPFSLESMMARVKARKTAFNKDIVVITDAVGLKPNQLQSIDPAFNTYFVLPEAQQKRNVAVDSVYIQEVTDDFYQVAVKISTYGENPNELAVALYDDGKLIAKTIAKPKTLTKPLVFTLPKEDFNGCVSIEDNALTYDNNLYFSIAKPEPLKVLSIGEKEKSNFLSRIYKGSEFQYQNAEPGAVDYNIIGKQDAIILNELKDIPQALQTTLKDFVEKGGNLVVVPSKMASGANLNPFLSDFGPVKFGAYLQSKKLVTQIAFSHPLYRTVFERKTENFQYPETSGSFTFSATVPSALRYQDNTPFLAAIPATVSWVYVFAAPLNKENSNFQNSPLIVPTFYNMAQSVAKTGITAVTIGENTPFIAAAELTKDEIVNVKNKTEDFIPVQQILNDKVKLSFGDAPQQAGNFGIYSRQRLLRNIGFNYARTEGDLAHPATDLLLDFKTSTKIDSLFDQLQTDRSDNEIWKWAIALCLFFLLTELCIQKFVK